jgi:hypothetical protein
VFDRSQVLVNLLFSDVSSDERAQTGYSVTDPSDTGFDAAAHLADLPSGFGNSLAALYTTLASNPIFWAEYSTLVGVKAAALDTNGEYIAEPRTWEISTPPFGSINNVHPQLTVVLSLRTGMTFGQANYGRMYLPHSFLALPTDESRASLTAATAAAALGADFINDVNSLHGVTPPGQVCNLSAVGTGTTKAVTFVGVGRVTDTQRRRRAQLDEETQLAAV